MELENKMDWHFSGHNSWQFFLHDIDLDLSRNFGIHYDYDTTDWKVEDGKVYVNMKAKVGSIRGADDITHESKSEKMKQFLLGVDGVSEAVVLSETEDVPEIPKLLYTNYHFHIVYDWIPDEFYDS